MLRPLATDRWEARVFGLWKGDGLEPLASIMVVSLPVVTVRSKSFEGKRVPERTADLIIDEKS